jgi:hypothetical protein
LGLSDKIRVIHPTSQRPTGFGIANSAQVISLLLGVEMIHATGIP